MTSRQITPIEQSESGDPVLLSNNPVAQELSFAERCQVAIVDNNGVNVKGVAHSWNVFECFCFEDNQLCAWNQKESIMNNEIEAIFSGKQSCNLDFARLVGWLEVFDSFILVNDEQGIGCRI